MWRTCAIEGSAALVDVGEHARVQRNAAPETPASPPPPRTPMNLAFSVCELVFWILRLHLLWLGFTLLGLGILGIGPSTTAAYAAARQRSTSNDDVAILPFFVEAFRHKFWRSQVLVWPLLLVLLGLWHAQQLLVGTPGRGFAVAVGVIAVAIVTVALAMDARYELAPVRVWLTATRFVISHPLEMVVLMFALSAVAYASWLLPGLLPFFTVGAWITTSGHLAERFFIRNDERVSAREQ